MRRIVPPLAIWLLAGLPLSADQTFGVVAGRVTDHGGGPLPGVAIHLSSSGTTASGSSSAAGEYRFEGVRPGRYRLSFAMLGFADYRQDITVGAGGSTQLDVSLHLALQTEVTVTGRSTFRNLAEIEHPESNLVGLAAAASEGAVTARQLERRPIQRVGEVVATVPGLSVTQHSGEGKANQYYLRGFNLDHGTDFSTMVAGVPINLPTHAHGHGYTDANFLIPELVTGVQYFKGVYTAEAGDFSSAGGVNINYASVLEAPMVRAGVGGQGWSRVFAAASPRLGDGYLLAAAETARSDGPWERPDNYRRLNAVVRYSRGGVQSNLALTGMAYRAKWNASDQAPRRAIDSGTLRRFAAVDTTTGGDTSRNTISAEWQRGAAASRSRVTGYFVAYDLDLFSNFTYFLDDPVNGDQFHQADRRVVSGVRASHERLARLAGRPVEYRAGVQLRRDDIDLLGLYRTRARERLSTVREDRVTQHAAGVWTDVDIRWTPWLRSIAGVRADRYRFRVTADVPNNSGAASAGIASPKGALVLGPWRRTEFYVNGGYGFHSNDARGVTLRMNPADHSAADGVTPLVRTRGAEIGARTVVIPGVQSTVAVWRLGLDSELTFVGDAGTTSASRPSERYGVEWSNFVRVQPWLTLDGDIAWTHARFTDHDAAGNHVPGAVDRVASVGIAVEKPSRILGSLRWRYFGPRPLVEDNSVRSRATSLVNAQIGYHLSKRLTVVVDVFNVLNAQHSDVDYFYRSRLRGEPDGIDDVHTHPALPRTARLTLALGF